MRLGPAYSLGLYVSCNLSPPILTLLYVSDRFMLAMKGGKILNITKPPPVLSHGRSSRSVVGGKN